MSIVDCRVLSAEAIGCVDADGPEEADGCVLADGGEAAIGCVDTVEDNEAEGNAAVAWTTITHSFRN